MRYHVFSDNSYSPLKIASMGYSADETVTRFGPGQRNLFIVHYVMRGKGYFNGTLVTEGEGFLIVPGQYEEYYADKDDPWEFFWVISKDSAMGTLFPQYCADQNTSVFRYDSVSVLKKAANKITPRNNEVIGSLEMLELFLSIFNCHSYKQQTTLRPASQIYLDFCIEYIESNIHNKITVEGLTGIIGVSQPYLYKIFKEKFNVSVKEYILDEKMDYAKKLLRETDLPVKEIASSVGYEDIFAFSKAFSRRERVSPQKYRKRRERTYEK